MNCSDISRCLDEHAVGELSASDRGEVKAHVSQCLRCARQWEASERLSSFRSEVPPLPAALAERARQLEERCDSEERPDRSRRPVLIGSLLLLGAAATTFAAVSWRDTGTVIQ